MVIQEAEIDEISTRSNSCLKLLVIVLSFNGCEDTIECLNSLQCDKPEEMDILVIDNASSPDVVEKLRLTFPKIEIVPLQENLGWAGGNNVGIRFGLSRGYDWICLLNNDTIFPDGAARKLMGALNGLFPCLATPSIYYWDEPHVAQLHPGYDSNSYSYKQTEMNANFISMDYAYGACLVIHHSIFNKIGLLDERYFLQLEETDYFFRSQAQGYQSICLSNIKILHKESRAFGGKRTAVKTYYATRNSLLLIKKKREGLIKRLVDYRKLYWSIANIASSEPRSRVTGLFSFLRWVSSPSKHAMAVRYGIRDFLLGRFGRASENVMNYLKKTP